MAKAGVSAPDLPVESEEESGEEETSSEEKDNVAGSEKESDSESESESKNTDNAQPIKKPPSTPSKNPKPQTSDSSSEEEKSESESESESEPTIKPILSKPVDGDAQKALALTKPKSKPKTASLSSTSKKHNPAAGAKRPPTSETGGDGEVTETRKKLKKAIEEPDKKSSLNKESRKFARRLFSEEDEIAILKGMADFSANKKADPFTNLDVFHEFIKKSIHVDVSKAQLQDKIRKMRKKYLTNAQNEKQGHGKIIINDHERKAFELSKIVWSNETFSAAGRTTPSPKINGDLVKRGSSKNVKSKKPVIDDVGDESDKGGNNLDGSKGLERLKSVNLGVQNLGTEEWIMQNSIQFVDGEGRAEMDKKWRRFRTEEAEIHCKRLELLLEEAKLLVDALRSSSD